MPTNDPEYQKKYMKRYRKMMKEAKELRRKKLGYDETEFKECRIFREQVLEWLQGKLEKTLKISIEWDAHMCKCHACAEWFVSVRHAGFKRGVNLWKKRD